MAESKKLSEITEEAATLVDGDKAYVVTGNDATPTSRFTLWSTIKTNLKSYFNTLYSALVHASNHTDGTDDIQSATNAQKGLATASQITAIEANTSSKHTQGTDTALGVLGTKAAPVDADKVVQRDSAAADAIKTSTWTQIKAFLKTYFDTLYNNYVHPDHTGDVTSTGDGATVIGADKVKDSHIDWGTGAGQVSAGDVPISDAGVIITATEVEGALQENRTAIDLNTVNVSTRADISNAVDSPSVITGGEITPGTNAGTFKVAAITEAYIRATASDTGVLTSVTLAEQDNQAITVTDTTYYVVFTYGDPCTITISESAPNQQNAIVIGKVLKNSNDEVHYINGGLRLGNAAYKAHQRAKVLRGVELRSGSTIAYSGTNNFTMGVGTAYAGLNNFSLASYDSAITTFTTVYSGFVEGNKLTGTDIAFVDGGAGEDTITRTAADFLTNGYVAGDVLTVAGSTGNNGSYDIVSVTADTINIATGSLAAEAAGASVTLTIEKKKIDFEHYDNVGALSDVGNNRYGVFYIYKHIDDDHVYVQYGVGSYSLAEAEAAAVIIPASPVHLTDFGVLIGSIVVPKAGGSFTEIIMVTDRFFTGTAAADHDNLGNLEITNSGHTLSATDKLVGRSSAGAGVAEEITCTAAGRALIDDADATAQRATLGVDPAGTDNSIGVTLAVAATDGGLSITGQEISNREATNAQTGYATAAQIADIESNTTHRGSTSNPHSVTKAQVGLENVANLKVNLVATTAPGVGNDNTEGYAVGSRWIDVTGDKEYVALDVSTGAAVWTETTGGGSGGGVTLSEALTWGTL